MFYKKNEIPLNLKIQIRKHPSFLLINIMFSNSRGINVRYLGKIATIVASRDDLTHIHVSCSTLQFAFYLFAVCILFVNNNKDFDLKPLGR